MCAQLLTSYEGVLQRFQAAASEASAIEAVVPKLEAEARGLRQALTPFHQKIKRLITCAGAGDPQALEVWHALGALRLCGDHPSELPFSFWYFQRTQGDALMILGPNVLTTEGPQAAAFGLFCTSAADPDLVAHGRRIVRQQQQNALQPNAAMLSGQAPFAPSPLLDAESARPLQALTGEADFETAKQALVTLIWGARCAWACDQQPYRPRYDVHGHYLSRCSLHDASVLFAWSDGAHTADHTEVPNIQWSLSVMLPLFPTYPRDQTAGLARDEATGRTYIVFYMKDNAFWSHSRRLGVHVTFGDRLKRAFVISWIGAPAIRQHLWSFAAEIFRVRERLRDLAPPPTPRRKKPASHSVNLPEDGLSSQANNIIPVDEAPSAVTPDDSEAEADADDWGDITDADAAWEQLPRFEDLPIDQRAQMLRLAFVFETPSSTRAVFRDAPRLLKDNYIGHYQIETDGIKEAVKEAIEYGGHKGYFEEIEQAGMHRRWRAIFTDARHVTAEVVQKAICVILCHYDNINAENWTALVWALLKKEAKLLSRKTSPDFQATVERVLQSLVEHSNWRRNPDGTFCRHE